MYIRSLFFNHDFCPGMMFLPATATTTPTLRLSLFRTTIRQWYPLTASALDLIRPWELLRGMSFLPEIRQTEENTKNSRDGIKKRKGL